MGGGPSMKHFALKCCFNLKKMGLIFENVLCLFFKTNLKCDSEDKGSSTFQVHLMKVKTAF